MPLNSFEVDAIGVATLSPGMLCLSFEGGSQRIQEMCSEPGEPDDPRQCAEVKREWDEWAPGIPIEVLLDKRRSLIRTVLRYIRSIENENVTITVLIPQIIPDRRRHEILHNQRGRLLETVLKARTNVIIATLPFHIKH